MSGKKANNNPHLCPIIGQKTGLGSRTRAPNSFSSLSLNTIKNSPPCQILVIQPAFNLSSYNLSREPHGRLRSIKRLNRTISCELVGDFISSYPSTSRNPIDPTVCRVEELSESRGCQKKYVFLWSNIHLNFISTGQYTMYLSLKNCSTLS